MWKTVKDIWSQYRLAEVGAIEAVFWTETTYICARPDVGNSMWALLSSLGHQLERLLWILSILRGRTSPQQQGHGTGTHSYGHLALQLFHLLLESRTELFWKSLGSWSNIVGWRDTGCLFQKGYVWLGEMSKTQWLWPHMFKAMEFHTQQYNHSTKIKENIWSFGN